MAVSEDLGVPCAGRDTKMPLENEEPPLENEDQGGVKKTG